MMRNITVAAVCQQGLGTSLWMKIQVEKYMSKYHIPAHVFQTDIDGMIGMNVDIAVGVSYLEDTLKRYATTVIVIDDILQHNELEQKITENRFIKPYLE